MIARDIKRIDGMNDGCLYSTCGTHVHMSHSSVTYESHPGFDRYLLENWRAAMLAVVSPKTLLSRSVASNLSQFSDTI